MNSTLRGHLHWRLLALLAAALLIAGCAHREAEVARPAAPTPAPLPPAQVANDPGSSFQPYVVVNELPPKPKVVTHRHARLHLTRRDDEYYLADDEDRYYRAGRDREGRLCPIYADPETGARYPLYYDR